MYILNSSSSSKDPIIVKNPFKSLFDKKLDPLKSFAKLPVFSTLIKSFNSPPVI
jgi:hypothetical protein